MPKAASDKTLASLFDDINISVTSTPEPTHPPLEESLTGTTLADFFDDVTIPVTSTPQPTYPLPEESLTDVRYEFTTNHYWTFRNSTLGLWIVDEAPRQNPLSDAVYTRFHSNDYDLLADANTVADLQTKNESLLIPLNSQTVTSASKVMFAAALGVAYGKSILLNSSKVDSNCVPLLHDLREERHYLRKCLLSASDCDYGLSFAVWVQFLNPDISNAETILATGPDIANGFKWYLQSDEMRFELWSNVRQWSIRAPFTKRLHQWMNIAVVWGKSIQTLTLFADRTVIAELTHYTGEPIKQLRPEPKTLWIGCTVDVSHQPTKESVIHGLRISGVALWYWPVQLTELLTAGMESYLLYDEMEITTTESPVPPVDFKDYTSELEELVPISDAIYPNNPMYEVADYYNSMQTVLNPFDSNDGVYELASERYRYAYKLSSGNGHIQLKTFTSDECPKSLRLCRSGLSIGLWMHVPNNTVTTDTVLDILQLDDVFTLSLFRQTLNIFIYDGEMVSVFRIVHPVPCDVWFNLGISLRSVPTHPNLRVYYNAIPMSVQQIGAPPRNGTLKESSSNSLFIGSKWVSQGAKGVSLNDLIMWYRALSDFEAHRFIGYTRLQLEHVLHASHYWTPDIFLFQSSPSQLRLQSDHEYLTDQNKNLDAMGPGYALASIYKSARTNFRFNTLDHMEKSHVPVFEMRPHQYMVLGREKCSMPTMKNLIWTEHCLHDPSERLCGARGFAISMWIKIMSVSAERLRFYLNSGDAGTSLLRVRDRRGIAIFSEASLLGVSVSQRHNNWKLTLDSSSYKQGQWINIGVLWDENGGLEMLLDGVDYGIRDTKGDKLFNEKSAPPYVVLGRLDDDDESMWLTPSQADLKAESSDGQSDPRWEMAHFALGEIVYYNRRPSHGEYRNQLGVIGVPAFRGFQGYLWHGADMIDCPINELRAAVKQNIVRPGPVLADNQYSNVLRLSNPDAVELIHGASLRLGVIDETHCTRQVPFCPKGLSIGAWIRIESPKLNSDHGSVEPIILFTGAGGRFGMAAKQNKYELVAWVTSMDTETQLANSTYECWCNVAAEELAKRTTNMQWIHYAMIWEPSTDPGTSTISIAINGRMGAKCTQRTGQNVISKSKWPYYAALRATQLYTDTNTPGFAYILISPTSLSSSGGSMSVAIVAMRSQVLADSSLMELMGLQYTQYLNLQVSTFYWPFSGLIKDLNPGRLRTNRVKYTLDKQDSQDGAVCTDGSEHSYIALTGDAVDSLGGTNLVDACVVNPTHCESFVLSLKLKRRPFENNFTQSENFEPELFRSMPLDAPSDTVGMRITLSKDRRVLTITTKSEFTTMINVVDMGQLESEKWIKLEVIYTSKGLKVLKGNSTIGVMENTVNRVETNMPLSSIAKTNYHMYVGRGFPVCISDVSTLDVPTGEDAEHFIRGEMSTYCYVDTELLFELRGKQPDHRGLPDSAKHFNELSSPITIDQAPCLLSPEKCVGKEITISVWVRIDSLHSKGTNESREEIAEMVSAVLFTTGPPGKSGVLVKLMQTKMSGYTKKVNLSVSVQTSSEKWTLTSTESLPMDEWVNLGIHWKGTNEDGVGNLQIYINGTIRQSSSRPLQKFKSPQQESTLKGLYFNKAYEESRSNETTSTTVLINGAIHNFAYWSSNPISCYGPRTTKRRLLGECFADSTLPETVACTHLSECEHADGAVCLDTTVNNLRKMVEQVDLLTDPKDFYRILSVGLEMVKRYGEGNQLDFPVNDKITLVQSILTFMRRWPRALRAACEHRGSTLCKTIQLERNLFVQLLLRIIVSMSTPVWDITWEEVWGRQTVKNDDQLTTSVGETVQAIGSATGSFGNGHLNHSVHTSSGTAIILTIDPNSPCVPAIFRLNDVNAIHSGQQSQTTFNFTCDNYRNNLIQVGVVTLVGLPAIGELKRNEFSERALRGYTNSTQMLKAETTETYQIFRKPVSKLRIQSQIYVCNTNFENSLKTENAEGDRLLQLNVALFEPNEYEATHYYRTTGRKRWKTLEINVEQKMDERTRPPLTYSVRCVHWQLHPNGGGIWDVDGCSTVDASLKHVQCACSCMGSYAVGMEPQDELERRKPIWITWGANSQSQHTICWEAILVALNALSTTCSLLLTFALICFLRKTTLNNPYMIRCMLSAVYAVFHVALLSIPYTERHRVSCASVGLLLHLTAVLTSSCRFCEVLTLFRSFVLGDFSTNRFWIWGIGLIVPLIAVGLPTGLSQLRQHGEDILCLPARESHVFWIMFITVLAYEFASITTGFVIGCNVETPAYLGPKVLEKLLSRIGRMNILIGFSTASWIGILLSINCAIPYLPYVALSCISAQGTVFFLLFGLGDMDVIRFYQTDKFNYASEKSNPEVSTSLNTVSQPDTVENGSTDEVANKTIWNIVNESQELESAEVHKREKKQLHPGLDEDLI